MGIRASYTQERRVRQDTETLEATSTPTAGQSRVRIIFEAPLQIQCKIITCTTPFPITLTLQSMVRPSWAEPDRP